MLFRDLYVAEPGGEGAEQFFESVSGEAERGYLCSDRYDFLPAEDGGELAGVIAMRDRTHLFHLFVLPKFQRQGLARDLWQRVRKMAGASGGQAFTVNSSLFAVPVYESFGFKAVSQPVQKDGVVFVPMRISDGGGGH